MNNVELNLNAFTSILQNVIEKLQHNELKEAYKMILDIMVINPNAPEPHNLLGLWFEMNGKDQLARKHYRIAYVLDPTYKPACNNLERISTLFLTKKIPFDFGEELEQEELNDKKGMQNDGK